MKVRIQKNPNLSLMNNMSQCWKNEGIHGFFKGMLLPLAFVSVLNSISMIGNEFTKSIIGKKDSELSILESTICGFSAGTLITPFSTPIEYVKCNLQIQQNDKKNSYYKGVMDLIHKTIKKHGLKGLFKGNIATFFRESFGFAGQFGSYHAIKLKLSKRKKVHFDDLTEKDFLWAGGVSGVFLWLFSYNFDVIKTLIQTGKTLPSNFIEYKAKAMTYVEFDNEFKKETGEEFYNYKKRYDGGMISAIKHIYLSQGVRGFWIGFIPVVVVTFFSNAILFVLYEKSSEYLEVCIR